MLSRRDRLQRLLSGSGSRSPPPHRRDHPQMLSRRRSPSPNQRDPLQMLSRRRSPSPNQRDPLQMLSRRRSPQILNKDRSPPPLHTLRMRKSKILSKRESDMSSKLQRLYERKSPSPPQPSRVQSPGPGQRSSTLISNGNRCNTFNKLFVTKSFHPQLISDRVSSQNICDRSEEHTSELQSRQ